MVAGLFRNKQDPSPEPFPPGTLIALPETTDFPAQKATVEAIVCPESKSNSEDNYVLCLDSGSAQEFYFPSLHEIVHPKSTSTDQTEAKKKSTLPYWIADGNKVTMDHNREYHKGFIIRQDNGTYRFSVRLRGRSSQEILGVDLLNFVMDWQKILKDCIIVPGHSIISSFLKSQTVSQLPKASFVSARKLERNFPQSLIQDTGPLSR